MTRLSILASSDRAESRGRETRHVHPLRCRSHRLLRRERRRGSGFSRQGSDTRAESLNARRLRLDELRKRV